MAEHEPSIGMSDEWYTPPEIFTALGLEFDLDPCSAPGDFVPAKIKVVSPMNGLMMPWRGMVWMNPPFGGRNGHVPWLGKFIDNGNGIALVAARTSSKWWHEYVPKFDAVLFPKGKTKFIRPDGSVGSSPGTGIALLGMGYTSVLAMDRAATKGLGMFMRIKL